MLCRWNLDIDRHLVLALLHKRLDSGNDVVHNRLVAFEFDH